MSLWAPPTPPPTKKNFLLRITWNEFWYINFCVTCIFFLRLTLLNVATKKHLENFRWISCSAGSCKKNESTFLKCTQSYLGVLLELKPWPLTSNHSFDLWPCTWTYTLKFCVLGRRFYDCYERNLFFPEVFSFHVYA